MAQKSDPNSKLIAENRRARFDYAIEDDLEAGIILQGSEVKSLRQGGANIAESYANTRNAAAASCWCRARSLPGSGRRPSARG